MKFTLNSFLQMKHYFIVFCAFYFVLNQAFAQRTEPIFSEGYYIIQDKTPFKKGDCIFCNTENMPDRIVMDSANKMVAKKVSNPFGYVYYEWKRKDGFKTFQDIVISSENYRDYTYFTDSGHVRPKEKNSFKDGIASIDYFRGFPNPKKRYNGFNIAQKIRVVVSPQATDSIVKLYKIPKHKLLPQTKWRIEFNFYESGHLQSTGLLVTGINEKSNSEQKPILMDSSTPDNTFKIGEWLHYDEVGNQFYKETLTTLTRMR